MMSNKLVSRYDKLDQKELEEIIRTIEKVKASPKEEKKSIRDKVKDIEIPKQEPEKVMAIDIETTSYAKKVIQEYLNENLSLKTGYDNYHPTEEKTSGVFNNHIVEVFTYKEAQRIARASKMNQFFGTNSESVKFQYIGEADRERQKWWGMFNRILSFMVYDFTTI
jgi:hypothetical protein